MEREFFREKGLITTNDIIDIRHVIEPDKGNIMKLPGTIIRNSLAGETIFIPPQHETEIGDYLLNLENYIIYPSEYDPLVYIAVIRYYFESIHPFYGGNRRTGRILDILFLIYQSYI